jgi:hypothetical protein
MSTFCGKLDAPYNFPFRQVNEKYMGQPTVGEPNNNTRIKGCMNTYLLKCGFQLTTPED